MTTLTVTGRKWAQLNGSRIIDALKADALDLATEVQS